MALPTLQGALNNGFRVAVVVCDMPELCKFPSLDSCQMRFLWTHNKLDILLHTQSVSSLVPQIGDEEKFPHALGFESLDSFFLLLLESASRGHV